MKNVSVLDSSALIAHFEAQPGGDKVTELLKEASVKDRDILLSVVNWGEVLYVIERRHDEQTKNEIERLMEQMKVEIVNVDISFTRQAAHLKALHKLPYVDCFAAVLALTRDATLVTRDKDFQAIEDQIEILWI